MGTLRPPPWERAQSWPPTWRRHWPGGHACPPPWAASGLLALVGTGAQIRPIWRAKILRRRPRRLPHMPSSGCDLARSLGHGVGMPMGHLPLAALAAIHLGGPQGVTARLTVHGGRGVLKASGIGHVTHHVIRLQFERVGRAVGETPFEESECLVHFMLPINVARRTQDAHRLVAGPERPAWGRVAVV